jgi:hypothetical protein
MLNLRTLKLFTQVSEGEFHAAIGCEKVNESRPVGNGHDGYDAHPEAGHQKPHSHPIEKVRESKFKGLLSMGFST